MSYEERTKKFDELCEKHGIAKPDDIVAPKDLTKLFLSLIDRLPNSYLEFKKHDSIKRALIARRFIPKQLTKNRVVA